MRPIIHTLGMNSVFMPAGCLHWPDGERKLLDKWVETLANEENGFSLLMGDAFEQERTHKRKHRGSYQADQSSALTDDRQARRDVEELAKILQPVRDRFIGLIQGNHYYQFADGTTNDQYLCQLLEIPFLGVLALVRLEIRDHDKIRDTLTLFGHHMGGSRSSSTQGGDTNALMKQSTKFDADIYCLSHTHRRYGFKVPYMGLSKRGAPRPLARDRVYMRTGAFLKGFKMKPEEITEDKPYIPQYAEEAAYGGTDLGFMRLYIDYKSADGVYRPEFELRY